MDKMYVRDLVVPCIIGTKPEEREIKQNVVINIVLECDLKAAGKSDKIEDTVNYKTLKDDIESFVGASEFLLIEKLADEIATICLKEDGVSEAAVTVDKPGALVGTKSVAVEIRRER